MFLTEDKVIDFVDCQSDYTLIEIIDRGSLKWPSRPVFGVILKLWSINTSIESNPDLFDKLLTEHSRSILVRLTLFILRQNMMKYGAHIVQAVKPSVGTYLSDL